MNSGYKQIVTIMTYLLRQNTYDNSEKKQLLLELSNDGRVQIDAIGSWIKDFSIQQFQIKCKDIKLSLKIFHGSIESDLNTVYCVEYDKFLHSYNLQLQASSEPIIEDCRNYLRFCLKVNKRIIRSIFPKLNDFFEKIANKFPDVKMSFSGNANFLKEKEATEKYIYMISESLGEILKHDTTLQFRDEINKSLNISNKEEAIQIVEKTLTNIISESVQ